MNRRRQAEAEFKAAVLALQKVIPEECAPLMRISFPAEDESLSVDSYVAQLEKAMDSIHNLTGDATRRKRRKKASDLAVKLFKACYPFTKLSLGVAQSGSAVFPSRCTALTLRYRF